MLYDILKYGFVAAARNKIAYDKLEGAICFAKELR